MMGWQWHQLDHMQIIFIQTDNHASTSPLSFYSPDALPAARPTASSKALKAMISEIFNKVRPIYTLLKFCSVY